MGSTKTRALLKLLATRHPIVQAPMAGSSSVRLAVAAARAGALGSLPCAMRSPQQIREDVAAYRAAVDAPLNLNFFAHRAPNEEPATEAAWAETLRPYFNELSVPFPPTGGSGRNPFNEELCALAEELRPEIVSFHFGLPPPARLDRLRASGAKLLSSATSVEEARHLAERGCDAIIVQGLEAGGHRGMFLETDPHTQTGLFALLAPVSTATPLPAIASGGIMTAAGVRATVALGAAGVQAGTAFLLCPESDTSAVHRAALASESPTAITTIFTGRPARGISNRVMRELGSLPQDVPQFPRAAAAIAPLRAAAESRNSGDFSPLWAGQGYALCRAVPAGDVVTELARGFSDERTP